MNILEHYIKEIHSVEPYEESWTKDFPQKKFVKVDFTHDCHGSVRRTTVVFDTDEWEEVRKQGYFMA